MKVLHVSKFEHVTGGVERHIKDLVTSQQAVGISAELFSSDDIGGREMELNPERQPVANRLLIAGAILWSPRARRHFERRLQEFQPDIVHYHSIYHQLSPSVLLARSSYIPAVMTLHDYKLAAPCYSLMRDGAPCVECVGKRVATACVRYRCVKNSTSASVLCAVEGMVHRTRYQNRIDRFIVPSAFAATVLCGSGAIPRIRTTEIAHGVAGSPRNERPSGSNRLLFVGRLTPDKAFRDLLQAWPHVAGASSFRLDVLGDGPERAELEQVLPSRVRLLGWRTSREIGQALQSARAVVVPSRCCETFGLVVAEAMRAGVPVVASDAGALPEHVNASRGGLIYPSGDIGALRAAILRLRDDSAVDSMGRAAYDYAIDHLSLEQMVEKTLGVYADARAARRATVLPSIRAESL